MAIDQNGLNNLLSIFQPKSNLTALREYREGLWKKLNEAKNTKESPDKSNSSYMADTKQIIVELQSADRQIQQAVYEEENRKLEIERLKREEAMAKSLREKQKALAKHEGVLVNACLNKLLSAAGKASLNQPTSNWGTTNFTNSINKDSNQQTSSSNFMDNNAAINSDLKESREFGIAAAEVARRRKNTEMKEQSEEAIRHRNIAAAHKRRRSKSSINVMV